MPLACFDANSNVSTHRKHTTRTFPLVWFNLHVNLKQFPFKKSCYHQGFFAVKRRAVFILGAKWVALVRGWRRDCVVGGMETRSQWRKAHSRTAKCEAFHVAPRLFFMFLFLITFTIRQQCIIYAPRNFPLNRNLICLRKQKWTETPFLWANLSILIPLEALPFGECHPNSSTIKRS